MLDVEFIKTIGMVATVNKLSRQPFEQRPVLYDLGSHSVKCRIVTLKT